MCKTAIKDSVHFTEGRRRVLPLKPNNAYEKEGVGNLKVKIHSKWCFTEFSFFIGTIKTVISQGHSKAPSLVRGSTVAKRFPDHLFLLFLFPHQILHIPQASGAVLSSLSLCSN